jgi:hypothetical protein
MLPPIHKLSSGSRVVFAHSSRRAHRLQTDVFVAALMREELETLEILPTTSEEKKKKKLQIEANSAAAKRRKVLLAQN